MVGKLVITGAIVAAALLLAACGSGSGSGSGSGGYYAAASSPSPSTAPVSTYPSPASSPAAAGTTIKAASSRLGQILVDANGRTLYLFVADSGTTSTCNSAGCVQNWPPVLTKGTPQAGAGVTSSLLGTTTRKDGTTEVTYAGHPLYYFIADKQPGQVTGQGIDAFGGPWYVVSPSGMQIG